MFTAALLIIAKLWEQPKCPSRIEQVKKCGRQMNIDAEE